MKVGSLVELVEQFSGESLLASFLHGIAYPELGTPYTVREIVTRSGSKGLLLEEIINPYMQTRDGYVEVGFLMKKFREIQPAMNISELIEECQTSLIDL